LNAKLHRAVQQECQNGRSSHGKNEERQGTVKMNHQEQGEQVENASQREPEACDETLLISRLNATHNARGDVQEKASRKEATAGPASSIVCAE
jgi:hypothetical protein